MTELQPVMLPSKLQCCNCSREFDSSENLWRCSDCDHLLIGTIFGDKYIIVKLVAVGGMSSLYQAVHEHLESKVALKVLPGSGTITKAQLERFEQEAKLASLLSHPNIARILDYGIDPQPYIVMDYIAGETLASLIARDRSVPQDRLLKIAIQVTDAMKTAHAAGFIHRDLKPSNIMIESESGAAKIIDFGLAKEFVNDVKLTRTGETVGSPPYMSPEQCRGDALDARSDIYSFGCLLYEAFTGVAPFASDNMVAAIFKHLETEEPPFKTSRPDLTFPRGLETVVKNCLHKKPDERYQSMSALKDDLEAVACGKAAKVRNIRPHSKLKSGFFAMAKAASIATTVVVLIIAAWIFAGRQPPPIVLNGNRLALGAKAKNKGIVSIALNDPILLNGKTKEQFFSLRQNALNLHKDLLAEEYKPLQPIFQNIDFSSPWLSYKGCYFTQQDGLSITNGDSLESAWIVNPLLLVNVEMGSGIAWNKRLVGDPDKIKDFPYHCKPEALTWNPPARLMEVTYDIDKYSEKVLEVDDFIEPLYLVDKMSIEHESINARDLGFNYMSVEVDEKDNTGQGSGPVQLALSITSNYFRGCLNNHGHPPSGDKSWLAPVTLHLPCTEKISLYREKPRLSGQKPDMTCLIHFKYKRDGSLNSPEFLDKRKAEIIASEGPSATALLSIYRRLGAAYLEEKKLAEAQDSYGQALKIASEKTESELNDILKDLSASLPATTTDAQIDQLAERQNWLPFARSMARGTFFYLHENPDQAILDFDSALKQKPDCAWLHTWRAFTLQLMGRYKEAVLDYKQAMSLDKSLRFEEKIKECEIKIKHKFELGSGLRTAMVDISRPTGISRVFATSYQRGGLNNFCLGRYADAKADFKEFIELEGWDKSLHSTYASIFGSLSSRFAHDQETAASLLSTAEPKTESGTWPHPAISYLQGHMTEKQLLDLAGTDKDKLTEAWTYIGFDLMLKNHPDEGKAYLRQVIDKGNKTFMEYEIAASMLHKLH